MFTIITLDLLCFLFLASLLISQSKQVASQLQTGELLVKIHRREMVGGSK